MVSLSEWLIDSRALFGKHARTVFGDIHAIFQANAELARHGDRGLVAEAHPRLDERLVAAYQVGPLMAVEADAVAGPVRQAGKFVVRSEPGVGDDFAGGGVHRLAGGAGMSRGQSGVLRLAFQIPD